MFSRTSRPVRSLARAGSARGASRSVFSALAVGVPLVLLAQALTSCGDDDGGGECTPGAPLACVVAGSTCEATQICNSDGSGYSACACPGGAGGAGGSGAGAGGTSNAGSSGAAGAGGAPVESVFDINVRAIGSPCETDADCPEGTNGETPLTCIPASDSTVFFTGGPQGGFCTARCADSDDCQALDPLSGCGLFDDTNTGYCIGVCTAGADDRVKCPVDRAQACVASPDDPTFGACFPICQSDTACGGDLFCDLGEGGLALCTAAAPPGGDIGAACTTETQATDCKSGICLTLVTPGTQDPAGSFCSASCTLGLRAGCGFDEVPPAGVARDAFCLQAQEPTGDLGDIGLCFELCDVDADCAQVGSGWTCAEFNDVDAEGFFQRGGECLPPGLEPPAPGDAGAAGSTVDGG